MPATPSSRPRSPSSTRSPTCAKRSGPTCRTSARGIGLDNRIGKKFLHAGPGYGGSCFPKDTLALLKTAEDFESPIHIVEAVVKVNDSRKRAMGRKVLHALGDAPKGKTVALLGLTFKPNTDDMRDAPHPGADRRRRYRHRL
jgi:UDPglucose 6-dehydrogenase